MGRGKIGAQCGHAVLGAFQRAQKTKSSYLESWMADGQRKVVLKDESEESLLELRERAEKLGVTS